MQKTSPPEDDIPELAGHAVAELKVLEVMRHVTVRESTPKQLHTNSRRQVRSLYFHVPHVFR